MNRNECEPNLNALLPGTIVELVKGTVRITDHLAESPQVQSNLIGYDGEVIAAKDEGWEKDDEVWFMPDHIIRVIEQSEE